MMSPSGALTYDYKLRITLDLVDVGTCGNGIREAGEQCDDGNITSLDGCESMCIVEEDYRCTVGIPDVCMPYESKCSDGMDNDGDGTMDAADTDCMLPTYFQGCGMGEQLRVYPSLDTPVSIPDLDGVAASAIHVVGAGNTISRVALLFNITHPSPGDLTLHIIAPGDNRLELKTASFTPGMDYVETMFDPNCTLPFGDGSDPYSDCFMPEALFNGLVGNSTVGTWMFEAQDTFNDMSTGMIDGWKLVFCVSP
jgi:cysteine-rich repeat protein